MLERAIAVMSRGAAAIAGVVLVYVTLHTLVEITLRTVFGHSTNVVVEFAGYGLAAMTYLALSDAMRAGSLVRVNIVLKLLPGFAKRIADALCIALTLLLTVFVAYYVWIDMRRSYVREFQTESIVPLPAWLPPIALLIGLIVFAIDLALHLALVLRGKAQLAGGDEA